MKLAPSEIAALEKIENANNIVIIQAENPDGDSLGTAIGLEGIFTKLGKKVSLHCPVDIPKYLRYIKGWDRVSQDFDFSADIAVIVDTTSRILISKSTNNPAISNFLDKNPVVVFDHHTSAMDFDFSAELISRHFTATGELIFEISKSRKWEIDSEIADSLVIAILSDSLGLTTESVTSDTFKRVGELVDSGANIPAIENFRREFMKKSPEILQYKGQLISRIEYHLDGKLAMVNIPWSEIKDYSDQYNPGALIGEELRLVEGVEVNIVIKTYPDSKLTARIRSNQPIADTLAGYFGGGGHPYAAGFRVYESYQNIYPELISAVDKLLKEVENENLQ